MRVFQFVVWGTLKKQDLHLYHIQVQALNLEDLRQIWFYEWLLQQVNEDQNFFSCVLATDKACFTRGEVFISYNTVIRNNENFYEI